MERYSVWKSSGDSARGASEKCVAASLWQRSSIAQRSVFNVLPNGNQVTRSGLFAPEKHFIGANGLPSTLKNTQVHPPVPNDWFEKFGLPVQDADVLEQDQDGDGFTNLDEWQGGTRSDKQGFAPGLSNKTTFGVRHRGTLSIPFCIMGWGHFCA